MMLLSLPKVKARLLPKQKQRLLRQLPPQHPQLSNLCFDDDDDGTTVEDLDLHTGYRRPEVVKNSWDDFPINDYVKLRLFLARQMALRAYEEVWG
jgi:hypothetical protein